MLLAFSSYFTDYITIHVRVFGNWTSNLQKHITGKLSTGQVLDQRNNCIDFSSFSQEPSVVNGYNNEHITGSFIHVQEANTSDIDLNGKSNHTDTAVVSIERNSPESSTTIVNVVNTSAEMEIDDLKPLFQVIFDFVNLLSSRHCNAIMLSSYAFIIVILRRLTFIHNEH